VIYDYPTLAACGGRIIHTKGTKKVINLTS